MPKVRTRIMSDFYLRQRELGQRFPLGHADRFYRELYSSILPCTSWDHGDSLRNARHGGVFNLEFSPDGSLLVAACEKKSILMFDPLCRRLIHAVDNAHRDCVNCVRFLDSRVFATCSDDSTVALWDARNLKTQIRTLHGHSNWVKNIEFSPRDGLLVTSGFDGSIYTWDINSYTESGFVYNRVFHTNGLMRTRLNPDASKMIICTTGGYLMIVHNLDLTTLAQDLAGFKPNMYRLMQLSQTTIPLAADFTHLFSRHRTTNRVEFVADFPKGDDAEVVSSLQVHPQGWCVLSRNISNDESSEWTCVHDIQEHDCSVSESDCAVEDDRTAEINNSDREFNTTSAAPGSNSLMGQQYQDQSSGNVQPFIQLEVEASTEHSPPASMDLLPAWNNFRSSPLFPSHIDHQALSPDVLEATVDFRYARLVRQLERFRMIGLQRRVAPIQQRNPETDIHVNNSNPELLAGIERETRPVESQEERESIYDYPSRRPPTRENMLLIQDFVYSQSMVESQRGHGVFIMYTQNSLRTFRGASGELGSNASLSCGLLKNHRIHKNIPRLTHYAKESNAGKGFIKELCFSPDGRLICSPYISGVRLFTFSPECSEMSGCVPSKLPVKLCHLATTLGHSDIVVSTKFSPRHFLLVSGCLSGKITWHQPVDY